MGTPSKSVEFKRELLFCWSFASLKVLVPKQRGAGYLKVPLGHHDDPALAAIETLARCDIDGLDGALSFGCGSKTANTETLKTAFVARVMPPLSAHYGGLPWREIGYYCPSPEIVKSAHRPCFLASGEQRGTEFYAGQAILSAATLQPHISFAR